MLKIVSLAERRLGHIVSSGLQAGDAVLQRSISAAGYNRELEVGVSSANLNGLSSRAGSQSAVGIAVDILDRNLIGGHVGDLNGNGLVIASNVGSIADVEGHSLASVWQR